MSAVPVILSIPWRLPSVSSHSARFLASLGMTWHLGGYGVGQLLNKIFNGSVNCCKYTKEGKDNSKNRSMPTSKFIKFYTTPDCNKNNSNHLKCQT